VLFNRRSEEVSNLQRHVLLAVARRGACDMTQGSIFDVRVCHSVLRWRIVLQARKSSLAPRSTHRAQNLPLAPKNLRKKRTLCRLVPFARNYTVHKVPRVGRVYTRLHGTATMSPLVDLGGEVLRARCKAVRRPFNPIRLQPQLHQSASTIRRGHTWSKTKHHHELRRGWAGCQPCREESNDGATYRSLGGRHKAPVHLCPGAVVASTSHRPLLNLGQSTRAESSQLPIAAAAPACKGCSSPTARSSSIWASCLVFSLTVLSPARAAEHTGAGQVGRATECRRTLFLPHVRTRCLKPLRNETAGNARVSNRRSRVQT